MSGTDPTHLADRDGKTDDASSFSSVKPQAGVKGIETISTLWTKTSLIIAYSGVLFLAFAASLQAQTTSNLVIYATSAFSAHSLVSSVYVVQGIVNAVVKPPMAKICDVFGRLEAYSISVLLYVLGFIQMAASQNVETFASAQIFYSSAFTGQLIVQQIFIADTTDLRWRALFSALVDVPFLVTTWAGPPIAQNLLSYSTWRWGYGLWAIVIPVAFMPLAISLAVNMRKASARGMTPARPWAGLNPWSAIKNLWLELDVMGLLLLAAGITLVLLPLTLNQEIPGGYQNGSMIAMLVVGGLCLIAFPVWEAIPKLSPMPFISKQTLKHRNVAVGCVMGFFYFAVFYTSVFPYFSSYLQVVQSQDVTSAGYITTTFSFTSTVAAVLVGILIRYTKHYKYFMCAGAAVYLLGVGLMIRYRIEGSTVGQIVGTQIALGLGGGFFNIPAQLAVQASVSHQEVAAATSIFLTAIEIGGAVGAAVSGAMWTENLPSKLSEYLPPESKEQAPLIFGNVSLAQSFAPGSPERIAINRSYQETMNLILIVSVCLAAPILPLSFLMKNYKLDQMDQRVKGNVIGNSDGDRKCGPEGHNGTVID